MKLRTLFLIALFLLVLLLGVFFYKARNIFYNIEGEILAYLEELYMIEIEVAESFYWPVNQITLRNVKINMKENNSSIILPEIDLYYDFFSFLKGIGNPEESLEMISLEKPTIKIITDESDFFSEEIRTGRSEQLFERWVEMIYSISPFQLRVVEGEFSYHGKETQLTLAGLNILVNSPDKKECRIKIETDLVIDSLKIKDYQMNNLLIKDAQAIVVLNDYKWQAILESDYFESGFFSDYLPDSFQLNDNYQISMSDLSGEFKPLLAFNGSGFRLENCTGIFSLDNLMGIISLDEDRTISIQEMKGSISFDLEKKFISTDNLEFYLNGNLFRLSARLDTGGEETEMYGHLRSNALDLQSINIFSGKLTIDGSAACDIIFEGPIPDLNLNLDFSLAEGSIHGLELENLVGKLRYYKGNIYLDQFNIIITEKGQFTASGIYHKNQSYSVSLEGRNIDLSYLGALNISAGDHPELQALQAVTGLANFSASISGNEPGLDKMNTAGKLEIVEPCFFLAGSAEDYSLERKVKFSRMKSNFYISEGRLYLDMGQIVSDWAGIAFCGEFGLDDGDMKIELDSDSLNLMGMEKALRDVLLLSASEDNILRGEVQLKALLEGNILNPALKLKVYSEEGSFSGIRYEDLSGELSYYNKEISIMELAFRYNDTLLSGNALIDLASGEPQISGVFSSDNFNHALLPYENIKLLALEGSSQIDLYIDGFLKNPVLLIKAESDDTAIILSDRKMKIDKLKLILEKQDDDFLIKDMLMIKEDAKLRATGTISTDLLDLSCVLSNLSLEYLPVKFDFAGDTLDGIINMTGTITGAVSAPSLSAYVEILDLAYGEKVMGSITGDIKYDETVLIIDRLSWKNQQREYIIDGKIDRILDQPFLELKLCTDYGQISDLFFLVFDENIVSVFEEHYYFTGSAYLSGEINNISSELDIEVINNSRPEDNIKIAGSIARELALYIEGNAVSIDKFLEKADISARGDLYFQGKLTGPPGSYNLFVDTSIENAVLGEKPAEAIEGTLEIKDGAVFELQQFVTFSADSTLELKGRIVLDGKFDDMSFGLFLRNFPLELISLYLPSAPEMSGLVTGTIDWTGGFSEPVMVGELTLKEGQLDSGLPEKFSALSGSLSLTGQLIKLNDVKGRYGDGQIQLKGLITPFTENRNLDLVLTGRNLPVDYGSVRGRFDADAELSGSIISPLIKGALTVHDLNVHLPYEWPETEGEMNWFYDFVIYPGEEVYLKNTNIDVLVQEGSLHIHNLNGEMELTGELSSKQGTFDYYNNKFILEHGSASFGRSFIERDKYIPDLSINAWTNVGGTRINVQLSGKSNNMVATFTSRPPLTEEEILTLLTSRGGLGQFAAGNFGNILETEFFRWVHNQIQADFIKELQEKLKKIFELDRFEIDTYNWGWNNQVSIYIGKYLNRRLYLEYTDIVGPDNEDLISNSEGELSLQYFLNENIILEGSWLGDDNYSFSIEGNFPF